jgi:Ca2+-binding RTX toxin-like protein
MSGTEIVRGGAIGDYNVTGPRLADDVYEDPKRLRRLRRVGARCTRVSEPSPSASVGRTPDGGARSRFDGGAGDDFIVAGSGADTVHGGADKDNITGLAGADVLFGDAGDDNIFGDGNDISGYVTSVPGTEHGNDILAGGAGKDTLAGQGGDDELYGGSEDDQLFGDDSSWCDDALKEQLAKSPTVWPQASCGEFVKRRRAATQQLLIDAANAVSHRRVA